VHILEVLGNAIVGGMENYVRSLIQALPPDVFKVTCLCPYESPITVDLRRLGHEVFVTPMDADPAWQSVQTTVGIIRSQGIHLLHAHLPRAHMLAGISGSLTQRPVVATVHGMSAAESIGIQQIAPSHLIVICQSAYMEALAWGVPRSRVSLIHNGVDLSRYDPQADGAAFRQAVGIPPDVPLVGLIGRLAWEKGPDQFIRAAEVVHKERPDVQFVLVGEGPMAAELKDLIVELRLEGSVHLAGLWEETDAVYPALDIVAQTSRSEGMPLALLEGMACGRPVASMGVGGVLEIVQAGITGLLSAPGDWYGVGQALLKLLAAPEEACRMGQAARQYVGAQFSLQTMATQTSALFNRLVQSRARPGNSQLVKQTSLNHN
jgi:glycosyltransferase involved in cell wall biosynthesis